MPGHILGMTFEVFYYMSQQNPLQSVQCSQYNYLNLVTAAGLVGQIYCTFSMGESLTMCNNVTISNK